MTQETASPHSGASPSSIAVLMTSFNRRQSTLQCLENLYAQEKSRPRSLKVFLVDDRSRDGTVEAVRKQFPDVAISLGSGDLFWNRGMHQAFKEAMQEGFDYYLWLNDDTLLVPHALDTLLSAAEALQESGIVSIVTGSTVNAQSGKRTYGGVTLEGRWLRSLKAVQPDEHMARPCDTMNGNFTLIPRQIADRVGNLDPIFHHSFGDLDYGFRTRSAGFAVHVAPGFIGSCADNSHQDTWRDRTASMKTRWRQLRSPKGSPFHEWSTYCRRHMGPLWPLYAVSPYVKTLVRGILPGQ